jgi:hypothetical protein
MIKTVIVSCRRKQANKEWFDEECAEMKRKQPESEPSKTTPEEPKMLTN